MLPVVCPVGWVLAYLSGMSAGGTATTSNSVATPKSPGAFGVVGGSSRVVAVTGVTVSVRCAYKTDAKLGEMLVKKKLVVAAGQ